MAASDLKTSSQSTTQYKLDTLLVSGYIRKHSAVSIPHKLLSLFVNLYHVDRTEVDSLYTVELVHNKLHRFFRRRPTMDDIENVGILPNGHSQAIFEHEIHSRLNRIGAHENAPNLMDDDDTDPVK